MKIMLSLFLVGFLFGCSSDKGSDDKGSGKKPGTPNRGETDNDNDPTTKPKVCKTNKVIEVLLDKKTIISQSAKDTYKYVVWDHETLEKKTEIDRSKNYYRLSHSGEYVLRKVNSRKFQVEHLGENSNYSEALKFSGRIKAMDFSRKSDFIISTSRSKKLLDKVNVFDIDKKQNVFEVTLENVKYAQMVDAEHLYILAGKRYKNRLNIFDLTKESPTEIKLKSGEVRWLGVSKEIVLAKIDYRYYAYDLDTQELLYNKKIRSVYDYDHETDLAIISMEDYNQIHILDMQTGNIKQSLVRPDNVYVSTCRFTEESSIFVCRSKLNVDKVVLWNTESDTTKEVCY